MIDLETWSLIDDQGRLKEDYNGLASLGHELGEGRRHTSSQRNWMKSEGE
ncbi:hypothetical protein [Limimaricola soesokkakensis]